MADKNDEENDVLEVETADLGRARRRSDVRPASVRAFDEDAIDPRARQDAIGERRRYEGPVFEEDDGVMPAALDAGADEEDVEPTEVAPSPDEDEDEQR